MRAQAQFTVHTLNDVVTSKTAPENPGQPKPEGESPDPAKKRRRKPNNRRKKPNPPQEG